MEQIESSDAILVRTARILAAEKIADGFPMFCQRGNKAEKRNSGGNEIRNPKHFSIPFALFYIGISIQCNAVSFLLRISDIVYDFIRVPICDEVACCQRGYVLAGGFVFIMLRDFLYLFKL